MSDLRRFSRTSLFVSFASTIVLSATLPSYAESRRGAPITYAGQGSGISNSTSSSARYESSPSYATPVSSSTNTEAQRTKRIEFRYPDQPNITHGSDGIQRSEDSPILYSSQENALAAQRAQYYASIDYKNQIATPLAPQTPVLHQPDYVKPEVEEKAMADLEVPQTNDVSGPTFEPVTKPGFESRGIASWYGEGYHGKPTANGETFDMTALTAAHPTLPLPSLVHVTNLENGREIVVRVNDRGPFVSDRMIDLSKEAAKQLEFVDEGEAGVQLRYLGAAPMDQASTGQEIASISDEANQLAGEEPITQSVAQMDPIPDPTDSAYFIQTGSFSQLENAERLSVELGGSLSVDVVLANVRGADFFRVLVGPYQTHADAAAMRDQLDVIGIANGIVISK